MPNGHRPTLAQPFPGAPAIHTKRLPVVTQASLEELSNGSLMLILAPHAALQCDMAGVERLVAGLQQWLDRKRNPDPPRIITP